MHELGRSRSPNGVDDPAPNLALFVKCLPPPLILVFVALTGGIDRLNVRAIKNNKKGAGSSSIDLFLSSE
jgi:hypothetical protein